MAVREGELRDLCEEHGASEVFRFWDRLDDGGRERLLGQVDQLDFALLGELRELLSRPEPAAQSLQPEPPRLFPLERDAALEIEAREAARQGERLLAEGLVGFLLVAGGQGSRLGFDGPKGLFPVGPVSGMSLFEWHARRLLAARERYGVVSPWYVMTSATNDTKTRAFFAEHEWFGLGEQNVVFFRQAMLPALDEQGRILMSAPDSLFLAPNGHGGVLAAMERSGALADAERRGVECFSYFQVDNPLAMPADPLFLGLHALEGASMSSKVVAKRDALEKVGVLARIDGRLGCIEYSDLADELRHARDDRGKLLFRAGNIALHVLERRFVEELTRGGRLSLPWHMAQKEMDALDEDGRLVKRGGVKFETFVFDALALAARSVTLEVDRAREFSPVKNAEGEDSPASARRDLTRQFASWLAAAGLSPPPAGPDGSPPLEVDPCFAEDAAGFRARLPAEPRRGPAGELWR